MIRTEKNKLIIEIPCSDPEALAYDLIKDVPAILQALQCLDKDFVDEDLPASIHSLLEFYKALLPTNEQIVADMIRHSTNNPT